MKKITIHTDGGCEGNPGPGGWGAVLEYGGRYKELSGGEPATTNNRMELTAALRALEALTERCEIELFTDSIYLRDGITKWVKGWKARAWITSAKKPVKNVDLWKALDAATSGHKIKWQWVRGHTGHPGNERCDGLATEAIGAVRKAYSAAQLLELVTQFKAGAEDSTPSLGI